MPSGFNGPVSSESTDIFTEIRMRSVYAFGQRLRAVLPLGIRTAFPPVSGSL